MRRARRLVVVVVLALTSAIAAPVATAAPARPDPVRQPSALHGTDQQDPLKEICKILPLPLLCPKK
jgi:hypothetical protein